MSTVRKLASQTVLYGFTYFAGRLLSFLLVPFYTRQFSQAVYGTYSLIYADIPFLMVIYSFGMETAFFYFSNKEKDESKVAGTAFLSLIYLSMALSGIIMLCSPWIASFLGSNVKTEYVIYIALILLFDNICVLPFAWLRKHDKSMRFAVLKTLNIILTLFFNFCFFVFLPILSTKSGSGFLHGFLNIQFDSQTNVKFALLANLFPSFIMLFLLFPEIRKIKFEWNSEILKKMITYSWPMVIMGFAGVINESFDRNLLKIRLPGTEKFVDAQIGIYSACYKISIFMTLAIQSFRYAAEPFFFRQMRESNSRDMYATVLKYFSFVTSLIFLGVLLYLPLVLHILGKNFRGAEEIVPILLLANLFLGLFLYLSQWYKQTERVLYGAYVSLGGAFITLVVNYAFIPSYGYMASAWATLAAYGFMALVSYALGQKYFPVNYPLERIGFYIWFSLLLFVFSRYMLENFFGGWTIGEYFFNTLICGFYMLIFIMIERPSLLFKVPLVVKIAKKRHKRKLPAS